MAARDKMQQDNERFGFATPQTDSSLNVAQSAGSLGLFSDINGTKHVLVQCKSWDGMQCALCEAMRRCVEDSKYLREDESLGLLSYVIYLRLRSTTAGWG